MVDIFAIKLILSFIVGGLYILFSTIAADKLGSKIGGLISGLPSTVLFGLFFIGWTQSDEASIAATTLMPAIIGVACLFLITFIALIKRSVWLAMGASFLVWGVTAYGLLANVHTFILSLGVFAVCYLVAYIFVHRIFTIKAVKGQTIAYSPKILLLRGIFSGTVVALSVLFAKFGGPVVGGMIATFPATFSSTLLITYFAHGADFSSAIAKSSLYAWISTLVFVIAARYLLEPLGIVWGLFFALVICYVTAYFLYTHVVKKHA
jgi:uncharacterized membrane protein (GlpM family)